MAMPYINGKPTVQIVTHFLLWYNGDWFGVHRGFDCLVSNFVMDAFGFWGFDCILTELCVFGLCHKILVVSLDGVFNSPLAYIVLDIQSVMYGSLCNEEAWKFYGMLCAFAS